jgi:hypothetical protein
MILNAESSSQPYIEILSKLQNFLLDLLLHPNFVNPVILLDKINVQRNIFFIFAVFAMWLELIFWYIFFIYQQADVFLAPQIHAGINHFQIDMVPNIHLLFPTH